MTTESTSERATTGTPSARVVAWSMISIGWALVLLADRTKRGELDVWTLTMVGAACAVLLRPRSVWPLLTLSAVQTGLVASTIGDGVMVHWAIPAYFHACLLAGAVVLLCRARSLRIHAHDLHGSVEVGGAFVAATGMFFAGFAKLNRDFLDHEISCGAVYYVWLSESPALAWIPTDPWAQQVAVWATVVGELVAASLLALRKTRTLGLMLLWPVLFALSLNPRSHYVEFAGLFFVLSLFFVDPERLRDAGDRLWSWSARGARALRLPLGGRWGRRAGQAAVVAGAVTLGLGGSVGLPRDVLLEIARVALVLAGGALAVALFASARSARRSVTRRLAPRAVHLVALPVALVFLANELTPYVGLKHTPTMTMASNVRLRPADNNHLLVDPLPTLRWSRDVRVVSSTSDLLLRDHHMPWVALVDRAARRPDAAFSFEIDDRVEEVARPGDDPRFQSRSLIARVLGLDTYRPQDRPRYCDKPPPGMSGHQWRKHVAEILRERERAGDP